MTLAKACLVLAVSAVLLLALGLSMIWWATR